MKDAEMVDHTTFKGDEESMSEETVDHTTTSKSDEESMCDDETLPFVSSPKLETMQSKSFVRRTGLGRTRLVWAWLSFAIVTALLWCWWSGLPRAWQRTSIQMEDRSSDDGEDKTFTDAEENQVPEEKQGPK